MRLPVKKEFFHNNYDESVDRHLRGDSFFKKAIPQGIMQMILQTKKNPQWAPVGSEMIIVKDYQIPPIELTVTAHVLCFQADRILMALHRNRGWDVPGGHIEPGESSEDAAIRETYEEARTLINNLRPVAHIKLSIYSPKPDGWNYPYPEGYLLFFYADFVEFGKFKQNRETIDRKLFTPKEAEYIPWIKEYRTLYQLGIHESTNTIEK